MIYNGTTMPEIITFNVTGLHTAQFYKYKLYAANKIYTSTTPATLEK